MKITEAEDRILSIKADMFELRNYPKYINRNPEWARAILRRFKSNADFFEDVALDLASRGSRNQFYEALVMCFQEDPPDWSWLPDWFIKEALHPKGEFVCEESEATQATEATEESAGSP